MNNCFLTLIVVACTTCHFKEELYSIISKLYVHLYEVLLLVQFDQQ